MRKKLLFFLIIATSILANAQERILRIVGSSAAYPYITAVAENFFRDHQNTNIIVESTGTGIGFKLFCSADQDKSPDLVVSSRQIKDGERTKCKESKVGELLELEFGLDGIILSSNKKNNFDNITRKNLFKALYKYQFQNGLLEKNTLKNWNQLDKNYPESPIKIYGPASSSATREEFNYQVMENGCIKNKTLFESIKENDLSCSEIRRDGAYAEIGKNENLIINKVKQNTDAIGITGYNFYAQNIGAITAIKIDGISPSIKTISNLDYPLSRRLYIYAKNYTNKQKAAITKKFLLRLVSRFMIGYNGYLQSKGLIPLGDQHIKTARKKINDKFQSKKIHN